MNSFVSRAVVGRLLHDQDADRLELWILYVNSNTCLYTILELHME